VSLSLFAQSFASSVSRSPLSLLVPFYTRSLSTPSSDIARFEYVATLRRKEEEEEEESLLGRLFWFHGCREAVVGSVDFTCLYLLTGLKIPLYVSVETELELPANVLMR